MSGKQFCGLAVIPHLAQIKMFYKVDDGLMQSLDLLEKNFIYGDVFDNQDPRKASIFIDKKNVAAAMNLLKQQTFIRSIKQEVTQRHSSKISIVFTDNSGKAAIDLVTELSRRRRMEVFGHFCSAHRTSLVVPGNKMVITVAALHKYFGLDQ
jgi:aspartokinase